MHHINNWLAVLHSLLTKKHKQSLKSIKTQPLLPSQLWNLSVADPGFLIRQEGWVPALSLARKHIIWQDFCQKLHEHERNWTDWGGRRGVTLTPLVGLANTCAETIKTYDSREKLHFRCTVIQLRHLLLARMCRNQSILPVLGRATSLHPYTIP